MKFAVRFWVLESCFILVGMALLGNMVRAEPFSRVLNPLPASELPDGRACLFSTPVVVGKAMIEIVVPAEFDAEDCLRCSVPGYPSLVRGFTPVEGANLVRVTFEDKVLADSVVMAFFWKPRISSGTVRQYFVAEDGIPENAGSEDNPWDLRSALNASHVVEPGAVIWFKQGQYSDARGEAGLDRAYQVKLAGAPDLPIHIRPLPGEHVRIEGGFRVSGSAAHLWIGDFEFYNADPVPGGEPTPPGSVPEPLPAGFTEWGGAGIAVMTGEDHVIYNNITHGGAHAYSAWNRAFRTIFLGNIAYDAGWIGADRAHGHCIYAQNLPDTGTKIVRHNLFAVRSRVVSGNYGLHFYAKRPVLGGFRIWENAVKGPVSLRSDQAHCEQINFQNNITCSVLVGDTPSDGGRGNSFGRFGQADRRMTMRHNIFIDGVKRLENSGWSELEVAANKVIKTKEKWWVNDIGTPPAHAVTESGDFIDYSHSGGADEFRFWPNEIDLDRAHLATMDFDRDGAVMVDVGEFLKTGDRYRIVHYKSLAGSGTMVPREMRVFREGWVEVETVEKEDALDMFVVFRHR